MGVNYFKLNNNNNNNNNNMSLNKSVYLKWLEMWQRNVY